MFVLAIKCETGRQSQSPSASVLILCCESSDADSSIDMDSAEMYPS